MSNKECSVLSFTVYMEITSMGFTVHCAVGFRGFIKSTIRCVKINMGSEV